MKTERSFSGAMTIRGATAWGAIFLACFLISFNIVTSYYHPPVPTYTPDFGKAQWIAPEKGAGKTFYRKNLYLTQGVRSAQILVAAPDSFILYVNSRPVKGATSKIGLKNEAFGAVPTALFDITNFLTPGINTVAIEVFSSHYTMPGSLLIKGTIYYSNEADTFVSDESWYASNYPDVAENLSIWTSVAQDLTLWPSAKVIDFPFKSLVRPLPLPQRLFQDVLKDQWISPYSQNVHYVTFRRSFSLPYFFNDGWLQLATLGSCRVRLNGHLIGKNPQNGRQFQNNNDETIVSPPDLNAYYIQPWLYWGTNQLEIEVENLNDIPSILAQISFIHRNSVSYLDPNENWSVVSGDGLVSTVIYSPTVIWNGKTLTTPIRQNIPFDTTNSYSFDQLVGEFFWILFLGLIFIGFHLVFVQQLVAKGMKKRSQAIYLEGLLHVPVLIAFFVLWLLSWEIHISSDWLRYSSVFWGITGLWLLLRLWIVRQTMRAGTSDKTEAWFSQWAYGRGATLILTGIALLAFGLRFAHLDQFSINNDECTIIWEAQGIWDRGYPSKEFNGVIVPASSYELVSYPVAISGALFGWNIWGVRLPAVLFGTLTTFYVGKMATEMFSIRVGLLASFLLAINPFNIYWSRDCFHPAQDQFFAVMCIWSFYRAIRVPGQLNSRHFAYACVYCICLYFSWEGTLFLLPVFAIAALLLNPHGSNWLRKWSLYYGLIFVGSIMLMQLALRSIKIPNYLTMGISLINKPPGLLFLDKTTNTTYYTNGVMIYPCHVVLVLYLIFGLFYIARSRPLRYVYIVFGMLLAAYSNLMPIYSERYFYYYQFLIILGASATLIYFGDTLQTLARNSLEIGKITAFRCTQVLTIIAILFTCGHMGLCLMPSSYALDLTTYVNDPGPARQFVVDHVQPGDFVIGDQNYKYYSKKSSDLTQNLDEAQLMIFSPKMGKFGGFQQVLDRDPSVTNFKDYTEPFSECRRVWIIAQGKQIIGPDTTLTEALKFGANRTRLVYTSYSDSVWLYEGFDTTTSLNNPDLYLSPGFQNTILRKASALLKTPEVRALKP